MSTVLTGRTCPFALCLVRQPHTHPSCPSCGAVRYGNIGCDTCTQLRGGDDNPHQIVPRHKVHPLDATDNDWRCVTCEQTFTVEAGWAQCPNDPWPPLRPGAAGSMQWNEQQGML